MTHADTVLEHVDLTVPDGVADCILARPAGDGRWPGVLFYPDAFGLRPVIEQMARCLASLGHVVLAPNYFYRSRRAPVVDDLGTLMRSTDRSVLLAALGPLMAAVTPDAARSDARAWIDALAGHPNSLGGSVGVVGYCMGGRLALVAAGEFPDDVAAAASFHAGRLVTDDTDSPHLVMARASAELYIGHADNDASMPPSMMAHVTETLASAHVRHTCELYTGAAHGWTMRDTAVWDEPSAERHWLRLGELFGRVLHRGG